MARHKAQLARDRNRRMPTKIWWRLLNWRVMWENEILRYRNGNTNGEDEHHD